MSEREKQYEVRFKVPHEMHESLKRDAALYGQSIGSFARHLFAVAYVDFQKQQELKHSSRDVD